MKSTILTLALILAACAQQNPSNINSYSDDAAVVGENSITPPIPVDANDSIAQSTVFILMNTNKDNPNACTGTLISENTVLTAAHCVRSFRDLKVVFGINAMEAYEKNDQSKIRDVTKTSTNWLFNDKKGEWGNDTAVIKFAGQAPAGYKSVKLLQDVSMLKSGMPVIVAGYGITWFPFGSFGTLYQGHATIETNDFSKKIITLNQSKGNGICEGDSGGPTFVKIKDELYQIGITSYAVRDPENPHNVCQYKSVIGNVTQLMGWINSHK